MSVTRPAEDAMAYLGQCYHCENPVLEEEFTSHEARDAFHAVKDVKVDEPQRAFAGSAGVCQRCWDRGLRGLQ